MKLPQPFNASTAGCRISCAEAPIMMRKSPGSNPLLQVDIQSGQRNRPRPDITFCGANSKSESKPTQTILPKLLKGIDY